MCVCVCVCVYVCGCGCGCGCVWVCDVPSSSRWGGWQLVHVYLHTPYAHTLEVEQGSDICDICMVCDV